ncbi:hypothetical protein H4582DRAFT_2079950 [Lactarius indigo]|nr:hypothetical protein H4582DRAFT_2079950 [Lactarius indigo]
MQQNIRISNKSSPFSSFDASTFRSHHTRLANYMTKFWNKLWLSKHGNSESPGLLVLPEMTAISSNETFGLVNSKRPSLLTLGPDEGPDLYLERQVERGWVVDKFGIDTSLSDVPVDRRSAARPVEQTQNGTGRMDAHSPDTVTPRLRSCGNSLPPNRKATERTDLTREGPKESVLAGKMLRTATTSESLRSATLLPPRARSSGTSGRRPHRLLNPFPPTTQHVFLLPDGAGLARSQRLFTIPTDDHIGSLVINRGDKFFLSMKLRTWHQWELFRTTPLKWVEASNYFNAELESVNRSHNRSTNLKDPCAIVALLETVEVIVADRLAKGNYKCEPAPLQTVFRSPVPLFFSFSVSLTKKGTETFYRGHYHNVHSLKVGQPDRDKNRKLKRSYHRHELPPLARGARGSCAQSRLDPREPQMGYSSDGVRSKPPDNAPLGYLPPWPQLNGTFLSDAWDTTFNPIPFLAALRDIYKKAVP